MTIRPLSALLALTCALTGCSGGGDENANTPPAAGQQALTDVEWVACAPTIVEGELEEVRDARPPAMVTLRLLADDWVKPAQGPLRPITFTTMSGRFGGDGAFRSGERLLVVFQNRQGVPPQVFRDLRRPQTSEGVDEARTRIEQVLREATRTECPAWWSNGNGGEGPADS